MKAMIVNVEKIDNVYVVTYESGTTRRYQELPKTAQAWLDAQTAQEDVQEEQEVVQDDSEEGDPVVVSEMENILPAPVVRCELAEIQAAELANIGNMVEIGNLFTGAADLLKNALVAVASVAPAVSDLAFQGIVAVLLALLFGFRGIAKAGRLAVRIIPAVAGGVADFFIGGYYFVTGIPTWILGEYSWMRWEAFPVAAAIARGVMDDLLQLVAFIQTLIGTVIEVVASGWALRNEIIAEQSVHS